MKASLSVRFTMFAATFMLMFAVGASAATFWYDAYGGFISGTDAPAGSGTFVNDPDTATGGGTYDVGANADPRMPANQFVDVTWGDPSGSLGPYGGRSGLALSKVDNGTVVTDTVAVDFGRVTHFNRPIGSGTALEAVQLGWRLHLFGNAADATNNVNPVQTTDLGFTIHNWETPNSPGANPPYSISTDGGQTWITGPDNTCPNALAAGTLIVGPAGRIYEASGFDVPSNPDWNGQCGDAHIFEGSPPNDYNFVYQGRRFVLQLSGFYNQQGSLTRTFWACEERECFGTVKVSILDVTPDLSINKTDGSLTYTAGAPIAYTLLVGNSGLGEATGASVADTVPAAITSVSTSCVPTGTASCGTDASLGNAVSFTGVSIAAGAGNFLTITVSGTVSPAATGNLENTATVTLSAGLVDPTPENNTSTDVDTPAPVADLAISKTDGAATYTAGAPIAYTLVVNNLGPSNATGVSVADTVPAAITGVSASCAPTGTAVCGTNATLGNAVSFTGASIAAGASNFLTITVSGTVSPAATGVLTNTAVVTAGAGQTDPTPENNTATDSDDPAPQTDLVITKTNNSSLYTAGRPIDYTIVIRNVGPSNATGVSVADPVPAAITGVTANCVPSGNASCGTNATLGNAVSFTGASIAAGAGNFLTITVSGTVSPGTIGELVNSATATPGLGQIDPTPSDNTATHSDVVMPMTPVPTLSEWGLILLSLLLAGVAWGSMRPRRSGGNR